MKRWAFVLLIVSLALVVLWILSDSSHTVAATSTIMQVKYLQGSWDVANGVRDEDRIIQSWTPANNVTILGYDVEMEARFHDGDANRFNTDGVVRGAAFLSTSAQSQAWDSRFSVAHFALWKFNDSFIGSTLTRETNIFPSGYGIPLVAGQHLTLFATVDMFWDSILNAPVNMYSRAIVYYVVQ